MLLELISEIFGSSQRQPRRNDTLNSDLSSVLTCHSRGVRGQIDEEGTVADTAALLKVLFEEPSSLHVHSHSRKDDGEIVFVTIVHTFSGSGSLDETSLSTNLRSNLASVSIEVIMYLVVG